MSAERLVLVTDFAWPNLDRERAILARAGIGLRAAKTGEEDELVALARGVDGILCTWKRVTRRVMEAAPSCLSVGRYGIGLDNIDVAAATALGIIVTNVPAYCVDDVADHAMALLLAGIRKVTSFDRDIKADTYNLQAHTPLYRLRGRTLGLAGFGRIGQAMAQRARGFGLRVIAYRRGGRAGTRDASGVEQVGWSELLARSDYLSIHLPSTAETRGLFDRAAFAAMKPGVVLVNTARGDLIDAEALRAALDEGRVAAAGLDVWPIEPVPAGDALARHPRVVATPHAAFNTVESLVALQESAATQMADVLCGRQPPNIVNPAVLELGSLRVPSARTWRQESPR